MPLLGMWEVPLRDSLWRTAFGPFQHIMCLVKQETSGRWKTWRTAMQWIPSTGCILTMGLLPIWARVCHRSSPWRMALPTWKPNQAYSHQPVVKILACFPSPAALLLVMRVQRGFSNVSLPESSRFMVAPAIKEDEWVVLAAFGSSLGKAGLFHYLQGLLLFCIDSCWLNSWECVWFVLLRV